MQEFDKRPSRLAALPLAIVFLFETWVWRKLVALATLIATILPWVRVRDALRRIINRLPALFAVLLFGIPLLVAEVGSFISVVIIATGHPLMGACLYMLMKTFGLVLVPVIFEITREKLLALPWFAYLFVKFQALHHKVHEFVEPYKLAAKDLARETIQSLRNAWRALVRAPQLPTSAARARAANEETATSSARAAPSTPLSRNH